MRSIYEALLPVSGIGSQGSGKPPKSSKKRVSNRRKGRTKQNRDFHKLIIEAMAGNMSEQETNRKRSGNK